VTRILVPGETCFGLSPCSEAGVLIDACDYYAAFYAAALKAKRRILLAGWQFNSDVVLLRGERAQKAGYPVELLPFLVSLCRERPELEVRILAWDFNPVFALEREWLQRAVFDLTTPDNLRFEFDDRHPPGGCHHQKFAVIDDRVAFVGGIDLACARWDDRRHLNDNPERCDKGEPQKPYHDTMAWVRGPAVRELEAIFLERWRQVTQDELEPVPPGHDGPLPPVEYGLALEAREVALVRTRYSPNDPVSETLALYRAAIRAAERSIYLETQYLTARSIHDALAERLTDPARPPVDVVLVMPIGADTPKERLVLGAAQERLLASLTRRAEASRGRLRVFGSSADGCGAVPRPTFIHSKLLIVDDRLLLVGSANLTNRSLMLDSELGLAFEASEPGDALSEGIARLRAELLAEHAGVEPDSDYFASEGLIPRLDRLLPGCRLIARSLDAELAGAAPVLRLEKLFDPQKPLDEVELDELIASGGRDSLLSIHPEVEGLSETSR